MNHHKAWRESVAEKEKDEVVNCKRCRHYLPKGEKPPLCANWGRVYGKPFEITIGESGLRNDAPFCKAWAPEAVAT